jgi:hypothetical protein
VVVENRAGAGGNLRGHGGQIADGYMLLMASGSTSIRTSTKSLPLNTRKDLPITDVASGADVARCLTARRSRA